MCPSAGRRFFNSFFHSVVCSLFEEGRRYRARAAAGFPPISIDCEQEAVKAFLTQSVGLTTHTQIDLFEIIFAVSRLRLRKMVRFLYRYTDSI